MALLVAFLSISSIWADVATPVYPCYNLSLVGSFYSAPLVTDDTPLTTLLDSRVLQYHENACLTHANDAGNVRNRAIVPNNEADLKANLYIPNTTYWFNEFLHVGHVHYDIVLMELLKRKKIDRIIMQRAACFASQCAGIGTIESYYKGYFAALFKAFNQPNIPIYIRYTWQQKVVKPEYFSADTANYYGNYDELIANEPLKVSSFQQIFKSLSR